MCSSLVSITIPDGVQRIDYETFQRCTALESVKFPAGLTAIGDYAFWQLHLADLGGPPRGGGGDWCWGFAECTSLTSVALPPGLTKIRKGAFRETASR